MSITRSHTRPRMSQVVVHGNTIYLAGQVAEHAPAAPISEQTQQILERIDSLLAEAGSDKSKLLSATIWLSDMRYYDEMNAVWDTWTAPDSAPARACVEARLAFAQFDVEIAVIAAV